MPFDPLKESLKWITPAQLKRLANLRLSDIVLTSVGRSRRRVAALARRYPSASERELAQHLIDSKKEIAGMVGGVSGVFGLASLPAD